MVRANPMLVSEEVLSEAIARLQDGTRERARQGLASWARALSRVKQAQEKAATEIVLPGPLSEGISELANGLDSANFFEAMVRTHRAQRRANEALHFIRTELGRRRRERLEEVDSSRSALKAAWEVREEAVKQAFQRKSEVDGRARQALEASLSEAGRLQQGCLFSGGIGCGVIGLYLVAYATLAMVQVRIGPDTPFGLLALIVACVPLAAGLAMQIGYAVKRAALESEVNQQRAAAQKAYDAAVDVADSLYRGRIPKLREDLAAAESELARLDLGLRVLEGDDKAEEEPRQL